MAGRQAAGERERERAPRKDYCEHRYSGPRQLRQGCSRERWVGPDHWNLELDFLIASLVLSKGKIGFLEISSVQSNYAKAA